MISMNDIAKKLNISRTTVSNILNERPVAKTYKKETISLVKITAEQMGYIPNNMAIAINTGITMTLAIVVPELSNTYYITIISIVEKLASSLGYHLLIFASDNRVSKENEIIEYLMRQRVDGLLIAPVSYENSLNFNNIPFEVVCFDRKIKEDRFQSITIDNVKYMKELINSNVKSDDFYNQIIFMAGSKDDYTVIQRLDASKEALSELDKEIGKIYFDVFENNDSYNILKNEKEIDFENCRTLFILSSSFSSLGIVKYFKEKKHNNYKILAFEHFYAIDLIEADIKVIDQPVEETAKQAFGQLMDSIQKKSKSKQN